MIRVLIACGIVGLAAAWPSAQDPVPVKPAFEVVSIARPQPVGRSSTAPSGPRSTSKTRRPCQNRDRVADQQAEAERVRVGLCFDCRHMRRVESMRKAIFYQCEYSKIDPGFPKYPTLPVTSCSAYVRHSTIPKP